MVKFKSKNKQVCPMRGKGRKLGNKYSTQCKNLPNEELQLVLLTTVNVRIIMRENRLQNIKLEKTDDVENIEHDIIFPCRCMNSLYIFSIYDHQ